MVRLRRAQRSPLAAAISLVTSASVKCLRVFIVRLKFGVSLSGGATPARRPPRPEKQLPPPSPRDCQLLRLRELVWGCFSGGPPLEQLKDCFKYVIFATVEN